MSFTEEMIDAFAAADLVICRAGFASLSEMTAALKKPTIAIPLPGTEQELNACAFEVQGAVVVVSQNSRSFDQDLLDTATLLLSDPETGKEMGEAAHRFLPTDDGTVLATRILKLMRSMKNN